MRLSRSCADWSRGPSGLRRRKLRGSQPGGNRQPAGQAGLRYPAGPESMAVGLPRRVIGSGGVFGPRPDEPYLDMPQRRDSFPQWAEKGWLPVAGDGCGNCYVLTADGTVGFVDTMKDPGRIDRQA